MIERCIYLSDGLERLKDQIDKEFAYDIIIHQNNKNIFMNDSKTVYTLFVRFKIIIYVLVQNEF